MMRSRQDLQGSRIGIVGYRDKEEGEPEVLDFVEQSSVAREFLDRLKAYGGGDAPEDVVGGLDKALRLSWSEDLKEGQVRLIVHITDAPAHGQAYHDLPAGQDHHPAELDAQGGGKLEALVASAARRGINYCLVAVNGAEAGLAKMTRVMKAAFDSNPPQQGTKNFMNFSMGTDLSELAKTLVKVANETVKFASRSWSGKTVAMLRDSAARAAEGGVLAPSLAGRGTASLPLSPAAGGGGHCKEAALCSGTAGSGTAGTAAVEAPRGKETTATMGFLSSSGGAASAPPKPAPCPECLSPCTTTFCGDCGCKVVR
jgi:hypothetical protein